jgi:zinc/manganese transport system substrate-binding protein
MRRHRVPTPTSATTAVGAGLLVAGLLAAGCGDDGSADAGSGGDTPTIAVTTSVLGDVVAQLTGDLAQVEVIMPPNADPHEFQPSAREAAELREADVVVANGAGFEAGLEDTLAGAEDDGATVFRAIDHVDTLAGEDEHADEGEADDQAEAGDDSEGAGTEAEGDGHADDGDEGAGTGAEGDGHADEGDEGVDPHFFTDPSRMAAAAEALAGALSDDVPALDTAAFRDRAEAYVADLRALDAEVEDTLAAVPAERRKLVTNHDVFAYFADRYGFEVVGAVIPSVTTQASPSAGEIDALAATIAAEGVPAIFADTSSPESLADTLADEVGDIAVVALYSESLGEPGSGADTYAGMVRTNATRIADALGS